jgi:hypothetical protein
MEKIVARLKLHTSNTFEQRFKMFKGKKGLLL